MGQSPYFWIAVAFATIVFALIDLDAFSRSRIGRVHTVSLIAYFASFAVLALAVVAYQTVDRPVVWLLPAGVRIAILAVLIGGRLLAGSVRTGERLVHPAPDYSDEPAWARMSSKEMAATLTPGQLAAEEAFERNLPETKKNGPNET
jgi:hypothetical protein